MTTRPEARLGRRQILSVGATVGVTSVRGRSRSGATVHQDRRGAWIPPKEFLADLPRLMEVVSLSGLAMATVEDGKVVWSRAVGLMNVEAKEPMQVDSMFEAASMSKPVFAYVVLKLAEEGVIDLDRPLVQYLRPDYLSNHPDVDLITARHVLCHSTGFPNWRAKPEEKLTPAFKPGSRFGYSGEAYQWLQFVVEKIAGEGVDVVMRSRLFGPAGMPLSTFGWNAEIARRSVILAVGCWETGGIIMDSQASASHEGAPPAAGGTIRLAAAESAGVEIRPVEFVATASEEWALPRDGANRLQLRTGSGHVRRIRLAPVEGDEIRVHAVREARVESQEEAGPLLAAMKIERRREGDAWVVEMSWPYTPRRRRTGPHSYTNDDPRAVTFEFHLPRGVPLDVSNANLSGTDLAGQDLREVMLDGANLSGAKLAEANMTGNDLSHLNLSGADLTASRLASATLTGTNLSGADLTNADLSQARADGLNLSGAKLARTNLTGVDLGRVNLSGADLREQDLAGLHLAGANLSGVHLSGKDLTGSNLSHANLSGANLADAKLVGTDLTGTNLSGANLTNADLSHAKVDGTNLSGARLDHTHLAGLDLSRVNVSGADLKKLSFAEVSLVGANLSGVDLAGMNLGDLDLSRVNLSGANLTGTKLAGANLSGANLSGADLTDTDLTHARVDGLNLAGARLDRTHLPGR